MTKKTTVLYRLGQRGLTEEQFAKFSKARLWEFGCFFSSRDLLFAKVVKYYAHPVHLHILTALFGRRGELKAGVCNNTF